MIESAILATDLGCHFSQRKKYKDIVDNGIFDPQNRRHLVWS